MTIKKILIVLGTRPEAIKLAPIIRTFKKDPNINIRVCVTGQHREMLIQVLEFFEIEPDFDLNLMEKEQTLSSLTSQCILKLTPVLSSFKPDLVLVQGDTTTAFIGALTAFYFQIKIAHVEAGLRSNVIQSPFPEEGNRKFISVMADYNFVPTQLAKDNLLSENVDEDKIFLVGNSVVDALFLSLEKINEDKQSYRHSLSELGIDLDKPIILVTAHRRESFGKPFLNICEALHQISNRFKDAQIVYPVHLNPNVRGAMTTLKEIDNIKLIDPLTYPQMIYLMSICKLVLTDSGGIQEEAPVLGKPVLVLRDVTERQEGLASGNSKIVGTNVESIVNSTIELMTNESVYKKMSQACNLYGVGDTSTQIKSIIST
jgi:UDP-N-acetylglucosamine 2-epimerase (non-hydrolysing)